LRHALQAEGLGIVPAQKGRNERVVDFALRED
jgi:hypothetical protein